jgi:hypothetical protein
MGSDTGTFLKWVRDISPGWCKSRRPFALPKIRDIAESASASNDLAAPFPPDLPDSDRPDDNTLIEMNYNYLVALQNLERQIYSRGQKWKTDSSNNHEQEWYWVDFSSSMTREKAVEYSDAYRDRSLSMFNTFNICYVPRWM